MKPPAFKKSTVKKRDIPRPHNGGEWTKARMQSFIKSALRGARWPQKYVCIEKAVVGYGINPKTNRRCKMHRCAECGGEFPAKQMQADHIIPVIGEEGFKDWNTFIERLYCEADGFRAICRDCHAVKTKQENAARKARVNTE